jgi:hypothetical protein
MPAAGAVTFIDVDSLLRRVYGTKKQGAGFGQAKAGHAVEAWMTDSIPV